MQPVHRPSPRSELPVTIIVFASIVATFALAGIIMQPSGVPVFSVADDQECDIIEGEYSWDDQEVNCVNTDFESQDWEECCEEGYEYMEGSSDYDTYSLIFSPYTMYFVLILIFSLLCVAAASIPMPDYVKMPLITLFGLATATSGIFLLRKFAITAGFVFNRSVNTSDLNSPIYLHVMPYFSLLTGILCLLLFASILTKLKSILRTSNISSRKMITYSQTFLTLSLLVFLISPMVPIAYAPADKDYEYYDEFNDRSEYLFPNQILIYSDFDEFDDDEADAESIISDYALVDNLFLSLIWINLGIIMLISLTLIPKAGIIFEHISQINILSVVLLILALIFSIIMYANLPDLVSDEGLYDDERYENLSFHANWFILIASIGCIINWVMLLIKSHIPWWKSLFNKGVPTSMNNSNKTVYSSYSNPAQQNYAQQQQYVQQQQFGQQNRGPPRF